jgi:glycosyltransferase involved in cell wall biosynthesis
VHSGLATSAAMASSFDILHYHALGPGVMGVLPRFLSAAKVVQTVHGLDDQRAKWGRGATAVLRTAGWLSGRVPDATIVVSQDLRRHYQERHRCQAIYVPNGVVLPPPRPPATALARLGLLPGRYLLFVGRFVPEKAPDLLLRAFRQVAGDDRLVLAGNSSFTGDYVQGLREQAAEDPRVVLAGFVYGAELEELYSNAAAFVLPWYAILVLPVLFAAGMSLFDTADGVLMSRAYGWAFLKPIRKVFYNLVVTLLSVTVALVIGLLSWLYLASTVTLLAAELNVVRSRRLWPRSLAPPPLGRPDERALEGLAKQEERLPDQRVEVSFEGAEGTEAPRRDETA